MGIEIAVAMARAGIEETGAKAWLHLDHGKDIELVEDCIRHDFDSVMIDGSHLPFAKNVEITRKVIKMAEKKNINVEAELGYVAKLGEKQEFIFTSPEEAEEFIKQTGVNALAIAIGSAHGFYKQKPELRIDILKEINKVSQAALVLHGSSGIPDDQIIASVKNGINKINLATEIKDTFMRELKYILANTDEIDLRIVFPGAIQKVTDLVKAKLKTIIQ